MVYLYHVDWWLQNNNNFHSINLDRSFKTSKMQAFTNRQANINRQ